MANGREKSKAKLKTLKAKQRPQKVPIGQDAPIAAIAAPVSARSADWWHAGGIVGLVALGLLLAWLFAGCTGGTCGARGSWLLVGAIVAAVVAGVILVADWAIGRREERDMS